MKYCTVSPHTRAGRLGFLHAIEFRIASRDHSTLWRRVQRFERAVVARYGRGFQLHWQRTQLNRRWMVYTTNHGRTIRFCFRTAQDQLLAGMLYQ